MTTAERVRRFILDNFYVSEAAAIRDETSLVVGGYVDSTGMLEVIAFLEQEYGIRIADEETTPENLDSIERIVAFVARKLAERAPAVAG